MKHLSHIQTQHQSFAPSKEREQIEAGRIGPLISKADQVLQSMLRQATCCACGYQVAIDFYDGQALPLSVLSWPESAEEAQQMKRLPLDFVRCVGCGHVYNRSFSESEVSYDKKPKANLTYNHGAAWKQHMQEVEAKISQFLPTQSPTVIEIGCGDGGFLKSFARRYPEGRFLGFDPNGHLDNSDPDMPANVQGFPELFRPEQHLAELKPDMILLRHVVEHLDNPLGFFQKLAFCASWLQQDVVVMVEVPCIDRVIETFRTVDFFYEHHSHFTEASFNRFLEACPGEILDVSLGYGQEVINGFIRLGGELQSIHGQNVSFSQSEFILRANHFAAEAVAFYQQGQQFTTQLQQACTDLRAQTDRVAIWGGTGKGAMFINRYGLDSDRFPVVIDSDRAKLGTFVPGAGQEILPREYLLAHPVEVIIVTTQWRASDILQEIESNGIAYQKILIEHQGRLIDYIHDEHPYRLR